MLSACAPRLQNPGPDATRSMIPQLTADSFTTSDGLALPLRRWPLEVTIANGQVMPDFEDALLHRRDPVIHRAPWTLSLLQAVQVHHPNESVH